MKKRMFTVIAILLAAVLLSPVLSSIGGWRTVHVWEAPPGTFGFGETVTLSVERFQSIGDPLFIFGGGRAVLLQGESRTVTAVDLNFFPDIAGSSVCWMENEVEITFPSGISVVVPAR